MTLAHPIRTSNEAFKEARSHLSKIRDDAQYHSDFDSLVEKRLMELDPEFMLMMNDLYNESGCSRWYE